MTKLEALRKQQGLTIHELAARVGIDGGNMWRIEKGKQIPRRELALRIQKYFRGKLSLDDLIYPKAS